MQLPSGRGKVNAWGENHLWLRYRKGSKLSGLVEPRISAALAAESVKIVEILTTPAQLFPRVEIDYLLDNSSFVFPLSKFSPLID